MKEKIKSLDELSAIVSDFKRRGKKIVQCHGVFDLLHPGHIRYLEAAAKRQSDILIVSVTCDEYVNKGPGRPVFNQNLRCESLAALYCVDYVVLSEGSTAVETILKIKPDVYVKGPDYADPEKDITGNIHKEMAAVESVGGSIRFLDEITFSSTELINSQFDVYGEGATRFLKDFRIKNSAEQVIENIKGLKPLKVLVIGETIIDEYHYCKAVGKPSKESIIATKYVGEESFIGGVLASANHLAGFVDKVDLVTCLGQQNPMEDLICKRLKSNVTPHFFYRKDASTIIKRRFVDPAFLTKMFEVCYVNDLDLPTELEAEMCLYLASVLPQYDLVVVIDYGHGFIGKRTVETLCRHARFLAVNTQSNSLNYGYNTIQKYPRVDYICLDDPEIRLAARNRHGDIQDIIKEVLTQVQCRLITVTQGHLGSITYSEASGFTSVPALSKKVVDRVGAGDAFLSITAPCVVSGFAADQIGFIGNAAGALAVGYVGNKGFIEPTPLFKFVQALLR